jgi:hypothetical protein
MNKKYLLVLAITLAVAGGLYLHIQKKKAADEAIHHAQQYERMLAMAQKSPMAGLTQMGAALNKYKADHQAYPPKLMALYPQYVPSKEFITEIEWDYRPGETDFQLSKSMAMGGKIRVASVSSTLMPQMENSVMVAAKVSKPKGKATKPVQAQTQNYEDFVASMAANEALAKRQEAAYRARYRKKKAPVIPLLSQTVSIEEADAVDLARANIVQGRFYCWKNDDGSYGYSNIQYPDRRKVERFDDGRWLVVETQFNQRPQNPADKIPEDSEAQALAALDRHKAQNLIVWRDSHGLIGYGNVQYPQSEEVEQYEAGQWKALSNLQNSPDKVAGETLPAPTAPPGVDAIAAQNSGDYMVWQDEAGHVGFSNVQYPQEKAIHQYQAGEWVAVAPVRQEAGDTTGISESQGSKNQDAVAAAASEHFIVWRDAEGHIGISNVQPPVQAKALEIHMGGAWLAVAQ